MPSDDFSDLKAGDKIAVDCGTGLYGPRKTIEVIEKVTAKQIVIGRSRFTRTDGYARGDHGYHRTHLVRLTPALTREIEHDVICRSLSTVKWPLLSLDRLKRIKAIVDEPTS
jgi:hypothetical protein